MHFKTCTLSLSLSPRTLSFSTLINNHTTTFIDSLDNNKHATVGANTTPGILPRLLAPLPPLVHQNNCIALRCTAATITLTSLRTQPSSTIVTVRSRQPSRTAARRSHSRTTSYHPVLATSRSPLYLAPTDPNGSELYVTLIILLRQFIILEL